MKRILALVLMVGLAIILAGCSRNMSPPPKVSIMSATSASDGSVSFPPASAPVFRLMNATSQAPLAGIQATLISEGSTGIILVDAPDGSYLGTTLSVNVNSGTPSISSQALRMLSSGTPEISLVLTNVATLPTPDPWFMDITTTASVPKTAWDKLEGDKECETDSLGNLQSRITDVAQQEFLEASAEESFGLPVAMMLLLAPESSVTDVAHFVDFAHSVITTASDVSTYVNRLRLPHVFAGEGYTTDSQFSFRYPHYTPGASSEPVFQVRPLEDPPQVTETLGVHVFVVGASTASFHRARHGDVGRPIHLEHDHWPATLTPLGSLAPGPYLIQVQPDAAAGFNAEFPGVFTLRPNTTSDVYVQQTKLSSSGSLLDINALEVTPDAPQAGSPVDFSFFTTSITPGNLTPPATSQLSCTIDYGDGTSQATISPCVGGNDESDTYASPGIYNGSLRLTAGATTSAVNFSVTVSGGAPSITSFAANPSTVTAGNPTTFTWAIANPGGTVTCTLDPGDGSTPQTVSGCGNTTTQLHLHQRRRQSLHRHPRHPRRQRQQDHPGDRQHRCRRQPYRLLRQQVRLYHPHLGCGGPQRQHLDRQLRR